MALHEAASAFLPERATIRRWLSRAFIISILVYLIVVGYLVAEAVMGASKWAPYGVNVPLFIALIIASEVTITVTAALIFREDAGIWPAAITQGWKRLKRGERFSGLKDIAVGAWDIPIIDLRMRTARAILLGRINRIAALVPLAYALIASAGSAPWGLRGSAIFDILLTLVVWAFMEIVMVEPETGARAEVPPDLRAHGGAAAAVARSSVKRSAYRLRPLEASDLDRVLELERLKWRDQAATADQILSRIEALPVGQVAAIHVTEVDGVAVKEKLVAWLSVMLADGSRLATFPTWSEVTADGTLANSAPDGDTIIGVNLTSVTQGATYVLLGEMLAHVVEWGKAKLVGGSRMNGFVAFNKHRATEGLRPLTAHEYVYLRELRGFRINEERIDAGLPPLDNDAYMKRAGELRAEMNEAAPSENEAPDYVCSNVRGYLSLPGTRLCAVMPDYFPDEASDNYGVLLEWPNPIPAPLRNISPLKSFVARRIRQEIQAEWEARKQRAHELAARRVAQRVPGFLRDDPAVVAGSSAIPVLEQDLAAVPPAGAE